MLPVYGRLAWRRAKVRATSGLESPPAKVSPIVHQPALVARLTYLLVALYALTFSSLTILYHDSFQTHAFDLGNMDQAVWNTAHGRPFQFTNWEGGTSRLAAHVEPILLLIAPLYHLFSTPKTLLVLQSVVVSLGALPAFWLARDLLGSPFAAMTFAAAYLLTPALEFANLAEFHPVALASSFLLFAFYSLHRRRYLPFFLFALLAMSTKEQVSISVFMMGIYLIFAQRCPRLGLLVCGLSAVWAWTAFAVIIPAHNPQGVSPYLSRYDQLGSSPQEIVGTFLFQPGEAFAQATEPAKVEYVLSLLRPTLYLALFSPATLMLAVPELGINLLSNFPAMYAGQDHYGAVIVPVVIISAVYGAFLVTRPLYRLAPWVGRAGLFLLSLGVLASSLLSYAQQVFLPLADHLPRTTPHHRLARDIIARIPPQAGVSASSTLNPHVSQRERLYLFPEVKDAEYVLLDVSASPHPIDSANQWWRVSQMLQSEEWGIRAAQDGYLLLERGGTDRELPQGFYTFVQSEDTIPSVAAAVTFGETLQLVGYDLHPGPTLHGRDPFASLTLYWQSVRALKQDYVIEVRVVTPSGEVISTQRDFPATLWYPTSRWQPGERVKVEVARVPLGAFPRAEVWLGVVGSGRTQGSQAFLTPSVGSSDLGLELRSDGTQVRLVELRAG